jgi:hypothetical protein
LGTAIKVSFTDRYRRPPDGICIFFDSVADARQYAYELLEATMDYVINEPKPEKHE